MRNIKKKWTLVALVALVGLVGLVGTENTHTHISHWYGWTKTMWIVEKLCQRAALFKHLFKIQLEIPIPAWSSGT